MESAELIAILREVRDKVQARHPQGLAGDFALPDLLPLVHARDAALGKVASIGMVNPRRGGPLNAVLQAWKRLLARVLDWHVREQVVFNRKMVECVDATIEALNENNRLLADLANHWSQLRFGWEHRLALSELQFQRGVSDFQAAFQHTTRTQHSEFTAALQKAVEKMRLDTDRLIHSELRLIRQRMAVEPAGQISGLTTAAARPEASPAAFDYARFAERFRGNEEYVKAGQQIYRADFAGRANVLDLGCGRGEFLEMMREMGVPARGIDLSDESIAVCRRKGLSAETADLFTYLAQQPEAAFDGIFCSQVVEHLPPERLPEMIKLAASRLAPAGVIAIETPNPECLAIFATHFYLDPTHTRPIPHPLLMFYLEEFGIGGIEVRRLSPALETMPTLASLPTDFRDAFFGGLDYAVIGKKL
ncbi:MAG TPA: methyltransferase domain-containing protein [Bryobacteraceae bacterium]|nr:methyltransferase domain-containing protein [Bryobacteraceae bacterium]